MTISSLPTAPSRTDAPSLFVSRADAFVSSLSTLQQEINETVAYLNALIGASTAGAAIRIPLFLVNTSTADSDPGVDGAGAYRANNATFGGTTQLYIDHLDMNNSDIGDALMSMNASTSSVKGQIRLYADATHYAYYELTNVTAATGYYKLDVNYLGSTGTFVNLQEIFLYFTRTGDVGTFSGDLANDSIANIKLATFYQVATLSTTTGSVNIDWTAAQNYKQNEPTGSITYTFTAPPGPCHLQLRIASDGTSSAQAITWPATVKWLGAAFSATTANKNAFVNFFYDGTNYWGQGISEV